MTERAAALYMKQRKRARIATLLDHFKGPHLGAAIGKLTDKQINDYYFHPRDRDTGGIIKPQKPEALVPRTLEVLLKDLEMLKLMMGDRLGNYDEAVKQAYAKYGQKPPEVIPQVGLQQGEALAMPKIKAWRT